MKKASLAKVSGATKVLKAKLRRAPKKTKRAGSKKPKKVTVRFSRKTTAWGLLLVAFSLLAFLVAKNGWVVAALVNNQPVSRLSVVRRLEKQAGKQTLEGIITEDLILQEAKKVGVEVGPEEVAGRIKEISDQLKAQGRDLDEALKASGQTRKDVERQIKLQLTVEKIVGKDVKISDEQVKSYYDQNKDVQFKENKLEEVKDQIHSQLLQGKINSQAGEWVGQLKDKANIRYFVKF